jgi:hypothetical protein
MKTMAWLLAGLTGIAHAELRINVDPPDSGSNRPGIVVAPPIRGGDTASATNTARAGAPLPVGEQVVRFRNGDLLHGALVGLNARDGLTWQRDDARTALGFQLANLAEVTLANTESGRPGKRAVVTLTNGDSLAGDLVSATKETVELQTASAGLVKLQRAMIASLRPGAETGAVVYRGPNNLNEWAVRGGNTQGWTFRKGALVGVPGGGNNIGCDVKLPDVAAIELEVAWQNYLQFFMFFAVDNVENYYNSDYYALQVSGSSVYLQRGRPGTGGRQLEGNVECPQLRQRGSARITVLVNRPKSEVAVLVNGALVKQWKDPDDFTGKGTRIGFNPQGNPMRISSIAVSQWDGRIETGGGKPPEDQDLLRLANMDKLSGKLESIRAGQAAFATSYATMQIPLERIEEIQLATKERAKPRRQNLDVLALLTDGGQVTLALDKLDDKALTGTGEAFGNITITRGALSGLRFNIYEPKKTADDDDWGSDDGSSRLPMRRGFRGMMVE